MPKQETRTVNIKYRAGHTISSVWKKDDAEFCPFCGHQCIWNDQDDGDLEIGASKSVCLACKFPYYVVDVGSSDHDDHDDPEERQLVEQLRDRRPVTA